MAFSLSGEDSRGPQAGAKGSCGTPGPLSSPAYALHDQAIVVQADALVVVDDLADALGGGLEQFRPGLSCSNSL